jgi:hypothetical protein
MTNDFNLNKIAGLRGIEVINLNDLAKALKPVVLPGEFLMVEIVKAGEGDGQGVGYLNDGTMVVVEGGRAHLRYTMQVTVTSTLQTSAGRMVFARVDDASLRHKAANAAPRDPSLDDTAIDEDAPVPRPSRSSSSERTQRRKRG